MAVRVHDGRNLGQQADDHPDALGFGVGPRREPVGEDDHDRRSRPERGFTVGCGDASDDRIELLTVGPALDDPREMTITFS
jgi:hypothetical protein